MIDEIVILNRKSEFDLTIPANSKNGDWLKWQTCVRKVLIGRVKNLKELEVLPDDEVFTGDAAYRFCMEVICGLHSPMPGETEVFGQFRQFVDQYETRADNEPALNKLLLDLITDAKSVRKQHLIGLGSQSYGSVVRRKVKEMELSEVNLLGAGLLVKDILPWLIKLGVRVRVHCRNVDKGKKLQRQYPTIFVEDIQHPSRRPMVGVMVIAAPLMSEEISGLLRQEDAQLALVMDLRSDSHIDRVMAACEVESLSQLFQQISKTKDKLQKKIASAREMINQLVVEKQKAMQFRPHGWYDIF